MSLSSPQPPRVPLVHCTGRLPGLPPSPFPSHSTPTACMGLRQHSPDPTDKSQGLSMAPKALHRWPTQIHLPAASCPPLSCPYICYSSPSQLLVCAVLLASCTSLPYHPLPLKIQGPSHKDHIHGSSRENSCLLPWFALEVFLFFFDSYHYTC